MIMSLGKKIIVLATLVVLGMQCLSCVLEIGFLYRRIENGYLTKYKLSCMAIKRKIERSLLYGKKIERLNYERLLKGLIPDDISNLAFIDTEKKVLFSLNPLKIEKFLLRTGETIVQGKHGNEYAMAFPVMQRESFQGNMLVFLPDKEIKEKIMPIVKEVILKFLLVFLVLIAMLYWILHRFMERPFDNYIENLKDAIVKKDKKILKTAGVDMQCYFEAEGIIDTLKGDKWLELQGGKGDHIGQDERHMFVLVLQENYELFKKMKAVSNLKECVDKNLLDETILQKVEANINKYENIKDDYEFIVSIQQLWHQIIKSK
ncbi:exported hypothetical protein [Desulfamplus magnetovallimortis]|uniref:Uncharacterized protein n=1 Tax=Desulfamplus magnetovallimortis TaxID=1246637 RepID=A0A1W1HFA4_9BACT|nr:hypothetical protein [Desulfamplus magnetovallimortis]SLM31169.1 exported hypothetical protein [Desulfamplus magnetovallimortis]